MKDEKEVLLYSSFILHPSSFRMRGVACSAIIPAIIAVLWKVCRRGGPLMRSDPVPALDLRGHGLLNPRRVFANLSPAALVEEALLRGEGLLSDRGALVASTGSRTGRSPRDRSVVDEPASHPQVWWGNVNRPIEEAAFDRLVDRVRSYLQGRDLFVCDA